MKKILTLIVTLFLIGAGPSTDAMALGVATDVLGVRSRENGWVYLRVCLDGVTAIPGDNDTISVKVRSNVATCTQVTILDEKFGNFIEDDDGVPDQFKLELEDERMIAEMKFDTATGKAVMEIHANKTDMSALNCDGQGGAEVDVCIGGNCGDDDILWQLQKKNKLEFRMEDICQFD